MTEEASVSLLPWYTGHIGDCVLSYPDGSLLAGPDSVQGAQAELASYGLSVMSVQRVEVRPSVVVMVAHVQPSADYVRWEESEGLPDKDGCLDAGWRTIPTLSTSSAWPMGPMHDMYKATEFVSETGQTFSWADIMPFKNNNTT
jgi:hypothetical protein